MHMYSCMCILEPACKRMHMYACIHMYALKCMHAYACIHMYAYACMHMHAYMYEDGVHHHVDDDGDGDDDGGDDDGGVDDDAKLSRVGILVSRHPVRNVTKKKKNCSQRSHKNLFRNENKFQELRRITRYHPCIVKCRKHVQFLYVS